jgi:hypothetical protein
MNDAAAYTVRTDAGRLRGYAVSVTLGDATIAGRIAVDPAAPTVVGRLDTDGAVAARAACGDGVSRPRVVLGDRDVAAPVRFTVRCEGRVDHDDEQLRIQSVTLALYPADEARGDDR